MGCLLAGTMLPLHMSCQQLTPSSRTRPWSGLRVPSAWLQLQSGMLDLISHGSACSSSLTGAEPHVLQPTSPCVDCRST